MSSPCYRQSGVSIARRACKGLPICLAESLERRLCLSTYTVSSTADTTTGGTLRQAILDANNSAGADEIVFDASFYSGHHTIIIDSAPPQINQQLTITGPGSSLLTIQRSVNGNVNSRTSFNSFATVLKLTGMTVTGGTITGAGGGLSAVGTGPNVTLDDMVFTGNTANGSGGAIYLGNSATLTIRNSVIKDNSALNGGGIFFVSNGSLVMENTTLSGNKATASTNAVGGGLYFDAAALAAPPAGFTPNTLIIRNSTFNNNSSTGTGGAIFMDTLTGTLQLQNSTISGNSAVSGGGIALQSGAGSLLVQNSTITLNSASGTSTTTGGGGIFRNSILNNTITLANSVVSGNINSGAPDIRTDGFTKTQANYSAIGSGTGFTLVAASGNNLAFSTNLMLDVLGSNGGPTQTHAILPNSPLLNAGSGALVPAGITTDQRGPGFGRIVGSSVDIGAYERNPNAPTVTSIFFDYFIPAQSVQFTFNANVAASLGTNDLVLQNLSTGATIPASALTLNYFAANNLAVFAFPGYPYGALPDGNYRVTLMASGIADASGNHLAADYMTDFFFLNGDANHDRSVGFADLVAVAQHYGATSGVNFVKGDFTYDGKVDFADLVLVAQKYGAVLAAPAMTVAAAPAMAAFKSSQGIKALFSITPVVKPTKAVTLRHPSKR